MNIIFSLLVWFACADDICMYGAGPGSVPVAVGRPAPCGRPCWRPCQSGGNGLVASPCLYVQCIKPIEGGRNAHKRATAKRHPLPVDRFDDSLYFGRLQFI